MMIDAEQLINEVKNRPVLWDISHPEFNHRQLKRTAWEEVAFNMFPDSLEWSNYDKFGKVKDLQKKWKYIRDSYVRDLKYERKVEKGMAVAKRKRFMYSHLLDFIVVKKKDENKSSLDDQSGSELDDSQDQDMEETSKVVSPSANCSALLDNNHVTSKDSKSDRTPISAPFQGFAPEQYEFYNDNLPFKLDEQLPSSSAATLPTSAHHMPIENDEDKMFLMSLLPYFKKLNEEKKLQARIGVENLLLTLLYKK